MIDLILLTFFLNDHLLTCNNKKRHQNTRAQCQKIVNIPLALMKQFNLFPVARGIVAIIHGQHILYTYRQRSNRYTLKNNYIYLHVFITFQISIA